jgi:hypothetical protein
MANRAYLVGSEHADTAGPGEKGINYNPDTEILAGASYRIPVFWLSIFDESHLKAHVVQGFNIPTLVADAEATKRLLQQRRAAVLAAFPQCESRWNAWAQLITEAPFKFFKIDATEVWDMDSDMFEAQFAKAVRWFSSGSADDFTKLLAAAELPLVKPRGFIGGLLGGGSQPGYDSKTKTITAAPPPEPSVGHYLYGYSWVRPTPWKDE